MKIAAICALVIVSLGLYAAFIDARNDYLVERRRMDVMTDIALKRERLIEAQAKLLNQRPTRIKVVYRELP